MWCANCQSDVAAEVTSDNRRIHCASCGVEIPAAKTLRPVPKTREARDLLERWSSEQLLDPYGPLPGIHSETESADPLRPEQAATPNLAVVASDSTDARKSTFRIDQPHPTGGSGEAASPLTLTADPGLPRSRDADLPAAAMPPVPEIPPSPPGTRIEAAHSSAVRKPHFDVRTAIAANEKRRKINWATVSGQMLAYLGVLGLTIGTSMVLLGHFRGPESQTATGWLITTAGQMLLFLGVVTLVSGGMEQTTDEVAHRIDQLGDKLLHIEQTSSALLQRSVEPTPPHGETSVSAGSVQPATNAK